MENKSHRTARGRKEISAPLRDHLVSDWDWDRVGSVLDFGCGKGTDAEFLKEEGFEVEKYDPYFFPEKPEGQFDVVLCNYVLCVVEEHEQQAIIDEAMSYVKPDGYAYFVVRRDKKNLNGWTSRQTFQRLVELSEEDGFELWVEEKGKYAIYRKKQRDGMIATEVKFTLKIRDEENTTGHEFKKGMGAGVLYTVVATFYQTPEEYSSEYGRSYLAMGVRQYADELMEKMMTVEVEEVNGWVHAKEHGCFYKFEDDVLLCTPELAGGGYDIQDGKFNSCLVEEIAFSNEEEIEEFKSYIFELMGEKVAIVEGSFSRESKDES